MAAEKFKPLQIEQKQNTGDKPNREMLDPQKFNTSIGYIIDGDGTVHLLKHFEGAGIDMSNYVSKGEFEQYEKRIDEKLSSINNKIDDIPSKLDSKIELHFEKMKNSQMKWFIGVLIALAGLAGRLFGLY